MKQTTSCSGTSSATNLSFISPDSVVANFWPEFATSNIQVQKAWRFNSTPPYVFIVCYIHVLGLRGLYVSSSSRFLNDAVTLVEVTRWIKNWDEIIIKGKYVIIWYVALTVCFSNQHPPRGVRMFMMRCIFLIIAQWRCRLAGHFSCFDRNPLIC